MMLVTGATGNVGAELVRTLVDAGHKVRALTRGGHRRTLPAGADSVVGDLDRPETLRQALAGVRGVFLLPGYQDMPALLAEIRRADAGPVVQLSGSSAPDGDISNAISRYMMLSEKR